MVDKPKKKKKFYKRWWFWLIVIVLVIAVSANMNNSPADQAKEDDSSSVSKSSNKSKSKSDDDSKMSKAEFTKIKDGMSYDEVVKIVGSKGEVESETGNKGDSDHTVIYTWDGDGSLGANANVTFQGEKVINKSQFGVDEGSKAKITIAKFNKIQNGMTYEQIQKIIGGKGSVDSETGKKGSADHTVIISYNGDKIGSNAVLTFQNEKLINKAQSGLK